MFLPPALDDRQMDVLVAGLALLRLWAEEPRNASATSPIQPAPDPAEIDTLALWLAAGGQALDERHEGPERRQEPTVFVHCRLCLHALSQRAQATGRQISPRQYAQLEVGLAPGCAIVRCVRHDLEIMRLPTSSSPVTQP